MPLETDDRLKALLAEGRITAVTLDTTVFDAQHLNLKSPVLRTVASLKDLRFRFLLSDTVRREVQDHLERMMEGALGAVKKALGSALYAFDTTKPTRDELLGQITGGSSPKAAAAAQLIAFLKDRECEVLDDASLVDVATLFGAYFDSRPPFSRSKKSEFPDALALHALDQEAGRRQTGFLVVSEDGDWQAFCKDSPWLYLVPKVEKALSLVNNAPFRLRRAVIAWFAEDRDGRAEVGSAISKLIESLEVDAKAEATSGDVETYAWAPEVSSIEWPTENDIDIIETEELEKGVFRAIVSLPILSVIRMSVELSFSVWDSIDKETVDMGGRSIELDRAEEVIATVTIEIHSMGSADEEIDLIDAEIDLQSLDVDLGEVDMFEPEDY